MTSQNPRREPAPPAPGDRIGPVEKVPTTVQLFMYSAATWNTHKVHYDLRYCESLGYPGIVVHSHLLGCYLTEMCQDWLNKSGRIESLDMITKQPCFAERPLVCSGWIDSLEAGRAHVALRVHDEGGKECVVGSATVSISA